MSNPRLCWLDLRGATAARTAIVEEAVHQGISGLVVSDPADLAGLPPTVRTILVLSECDGDELALDGADLVFVDGPAERVRALAADHPTVEFGRFVRIVDAASLDEACTAARTETWSLLDFRDPTKIPLEIVIAAAAAATGTIVTVAASVQEAEILCGVLELGSDGVLVPADTVGVATALRSAASSSRGEVALVPLTVVTATHIGMGDRACVDTCTYFRPDEGILVGSHSKGMVLCVSETHPLPYMQTRPFRVNAGAIHSYTLSASGRTHYLSELSAGSKVLGVDIHGHTRVINVGRVKIETRPLISIDAVAENGQPVNLILQDDWHVRVLGPGGSVLNSTELKAGDVLLGHLPTADRHVGYPIEEFCLER